MPCTHFKQQKSRQPHSSAIGAIFSKCYPESLFGKGGIQFTECGKDVIQIGL